MLNSEEATLAQKSAELILDWKDIWKNIEVALLRLKPKEIIIQDEETGVPIAVQSPNVFEEDPDAKPLVTKEGLNILYSELISVVNRNTFLAKLRRDEAMKIVRQISERLAKVLVANYKTILYGEEVEEKEVIMPNGKVTKIREKKVNVSDINLVMHIINENLYMAVNRAIDGHTADILKTIEKIHEVVREGGVEGEEKKKKRFGIFG